MHVSKEVFRTTTFTNLVFSLVQQQIMQIFYLSRRLFALLCCLLFTFQVLAFDWPERLQLHNGGQLQPLQLQPQLSKVNLGAYTADDGIEFYLSGGWLVQTAQQPDLKMWRQLQVSNPKLLAHLGQQLLWLVQPEQPELWFAHALPLQHYPWLLNYQPDFYTKAANKKWLQTTSLSTKLMPANATTRAILTASYWQRLQQRSTGEHAVIALIDDAVTLTAPWLQGLNLQLYYDVDQKTTSSPAVFPQHSHGDQMAALIFARSDQGQSGGVAPKAKAVILKQSLGWTSDILLALHLAELSDAQIINCSWTMPYLSDLIAQKIAHLTKPSQTHAGVAVVVAAGNHKQEVAKSNPLAALPGVISVGLLDSKLQPQSNTGKVDIWVQGPLYLPDGRVISGSSAAAAIVSGVLALKYSLQPDVPVTQLTEQLKTELTIKVQ